MSDDDTAAHGPYDGARTGGSGTPVAVDVSSDRGARDTWLVFLAGPVLWFGHFMLVYLVAEAGCTGDGPGLRLFDPPVPGVTTVVATAVATAACLAFAVWGYRLWRATGTRSGSSEAPPSDRRSDHDPGGGLAFAGFLLSLLSALSVLFVGVPALVLPSC